MPPSYLGLHVRSRIFLPDFNKIWVVSAELNGKSPVSYITEIRLVRAVLIHANILTGMGAKKKKRKKVPAPTVTRLKPTNILSLLIMNFSTMISYRFHSIKVKN
jgi:hypothetical protein